jgi:hypothetical protein
MRFGELKSVAHNLADSISSGIGLPIGLYAYDIFDEAKASPEGYIEIDFVTGAMKGAMPSNVLSEALLQYKRWLVELASKHGVAVSDFTELTIRFGVDVVYGPHFTVSIADQKGRSDVTTYSGMGGKTLTKARR